MAVLSQSSNDHYNNNLRGRSDYCHHFHKSTQSTLGGGGGGERRGGGVNVQCTFLNNVDYDALHFHTGSLQKSTFSECSFGMEGVTKRVGLLCVRF